MDPFGIRRTINRNVYKAMVFLQSAELKFLPEAEIVKRVKKQARAIKDNPDIDETIHQSLLNLTELGILACTGTSNYSIRHSLKPAGLSNELWAQRAKLSRNSLRAQVNARKRSKNGIGIQDFPSGKSAVMCAECKPVITLFTQSLGELNLGGSPSDFVNVTSESNMNEDQSEDKPEIDDEDQNLYNLK